MAASFSRTTYFPFSTVPKVSKEADLNKQVTPDILRKRLIFRCTNRGIKELDLVMGNWAKEHVQSLSDAECEELQTILNEETLDLVNIFIKREAVPPHLDNSVMHQIIKWKDSGNVTGYAK
eukprot:CAMPEP_0197022756 /NCGR_PEP_ID=MMETSP1384-20130603/3574_1 /TAXON_ID=29189 /ORGANISM="Ammonia sp." /LENGTH=120 /DNA_ID=CAMNT_0042450853 /DNA_START=77 /DNA_END=439 /DNA_ORIENTATION=-